MMNNNLPHFQFSYDEKGTVVETDQPDRYQAFVTFLYLQCSTPQACRLYLEAIYELQHEGVSKNHGVGRVAELTMTRETATVRITSHELAGETYYEQDQTMPLEDFRVLVLTWRKHLDTQP